MKKLTSILALFITLGVCAQEKGAISGKIMDLEIENEPMLLANVQIKGGSKATQTNFHGNFELKDIPVGQHTLIVSYAGYEKLEIPVQVEKDKIAEVNGGLSQKTLFGSDMAITKTIQKEFTRGPSLR
ncbi:carboxypeptidase-like regulatory domain-containing protein [Maribacter polysiphoniae]|uniref:Carboxypeptidase-like regulatory domain-containing protein n=1 Tax=Maribacter polysiphoniae TaxID=429344 RepID=A0A316E997_9FLAO|nr:carboxypeptidase-like regulatory domain-containing protein [Maribacter polysiphoniae]MBD1259859.1 carboxypeptidase-like regulatory domain-containing protein [Maribacter polysiphoniae]PWK25313.1 outer membrane receptor for ferrienterochelin and colicins [Maribacter polysiphoniae]